MFLNLLLLYFGCFLLSKFPIVSFLLYQFCFDLFLAVNVIL